MDFLRISEEFLKTSKGVPENWEFPKVFLNNSRGIPKKLPKEFLRTGIPKEKIPTNFWEIISE